MKCHLKLHIDITLPYIVDADRTMRLSVNVCTQHMNSSELEFANLSSEDMLSNSHSMVFLEELVELPRMRLLYSL